MSTDDPMRRERVLDAILRVWARLLMDNGVSADTHFFDAGADSLMAVGMQSEIEGLLGVIIPAGTIYQAPTAGGFAVLVEECPRDSKRPIVTMLNGGGKRPPVHGIAPIEGGVFHFLELARALGDEQPLCCIEPRTASGGRHGYASIEELAGCCIDAVKCLQPHGPYLLCGYSFGGTIAWEMARQLEARKESVGMLVVVDGWCMGNDARNPVAAFPGWKKILYYAGRLDDYRERHASRGSSIDYINILKLLCENVRAAAQNRFMKNEPSAPVAIDSGGDDVVLNRSLPDESKDTFKLRQQYDYRHYAGRLYLIRAREQPTIGKTLDHSLGWEGRAMGGLHILDTPGGHHSILSQPLVGRVGEHINRVLKAVHHKRERGTTDAAADRRQCPAFPYETISGPLERFQAVCAALPGQLAVSDDERLLTYAELDQESDRIAAALGASHVAVGSGVMLFLPNGCDFVAAMLGVLKNGCYYMPVDPGQPRARITHMIKDSGPTAVVSHGRHGKIIDEVFQGRPTILLDRDVAGVATDPVKLKDAQAAASPEGRAVLIYTSGSSGKPKGVLHTHTSLAHIAWRRAHILGLTAEDNLLSTYTGEFIGALSGQWACLFSGATLHVYNLRKAGFGGLAAWMNARRISVLHMVTSIYRRFEYTLQPGASFPYLRLILPGGEPLVAEDIERYKKQFSASVSLLAGIGSTECGDIASYAITHRTVINKVIPAGYALPGITILILDTNGHEVGKGEEGEIAIMSSEKRGTYWSDEVQTLSGLIAVAAGKVAFRTGDYGRLERDGCLINLGRRDRLVKINGYRIELSEVESALLAHPDIAEATVLCEPSQVARGEHQLFAFYRMREGTGEAEIRDIREFLLGHIPTAMIPGYFKALREFPVLYNGKLDKVALARLIPEPAMARLP